MSLIINVAIVLMIIFGVGFFVLSSVLFIVVISHLLTLSGIDFLNEHIWITRSISAAIWLIVLGIMGIIHHINLKENQRRARGGSGAYLRGPDYGSADEIMDAERRGINTGSFNY